MRDGAPNGGKLCMVKVATSAYSPYGWIQTWVTVWKHQIWVKICEFLSCVTLKFDRWHWKTIGHLFCVSSSCVHYFIAICEFKLELWCGNAQIGEICLFWSLWPWPLTFILCMEITSVDSNNSWKFHENLMKNVWQTDRQTRWTEGLNHS